MKLTVVAVRVPDPQLRDGHIQKVKAWVSTDNGAVFVSTVVRVELGAGVLEQHVAGMEPAAFQVDTKGRGAPLLNRTRKNHRLTLMSLQELNVIVDWMETKRNESKHIISF